MHIVFEHCTYRFFTKVKIITSEKVNFLLGKTCFCFKKKIEKVFQLENMSAFADKENEV